MARPREYTPDTLERAVKKYFRSITRQVPLTEMVPTGDKDDKGHPIMEPRAVINDLGKQVVITEYLLPPSVTDLCEALHIHRSTWANYCDSDLHPELEEITLHAMQPNPDDRYRTIDEMLADGSLVLLGTDVKDARAVSTQDSMQNSMFAVSLTRPTRRCSTRP